MPDIRCLRMTPNTEPSTPERHPPPIRPFVRLRALIDCQDTMRNWHEAEIVRLEAGRAFVHYTYWTCRWDEWIGVNDERLQPHGTHVCEWMFVVYKMAAYCTLKKRVRLLA
jgi:hypothetical protein